MSTHTGLYKNVGRHAYDGHAPGSVFEVTAEKSTIGSLVIAGVLKPALPETEEGDK